ncbi:FtsW/RodA/SpoVE family cell cycle protein [Streptacidiphilus sp. PB12-B1b]|uniref:FtsW/RodA/SpoVE family cell cycle protein n=1 Tax=Streptacidiphilus sp. PB12-B1b TaxID=2705012 RepID=UPI0015FC1515|nr:FtsW/RodA/SpoVE family cell cycle protein [Streptacidiphilus sp. PB12-B1b]QMU79186.1 FtsW/RodA/SpoVE family cell cycle protein [Streptacidiphilus sp. PB12-B1b]
MGARGAATRGPGPGSGRKRNLELVLIVFAVAVPAFGYADAMLALKGALPSGFVLQVGCFAVLALAAHMVVRRWAAYADPLILPITVLLSGLGLMMIKRLDVSYGKEYQGYVPLIGGQIQWLVIGVAVFLGCVVVIKHHRVLQRYTYVLMAASLVLLIGPAFFPATFGARRWIYIGPLQFEPAEFTKISIVIFFASYLMANRDALALVGRKVWGVSFPRGRNLGPILVIWAVCLLVLIFEVDLGTSLIIFGIFVIMLYIATERTGWVILGVALATGGAYVVGSLSPHVGARVTGWLHPMDAFKTGSTMSPQQAQALFSLGHGGFLGTGLGEGQPWLIGFAGQSDWIVASFGEELGTAGVMVIIMLYVLMAERSLRTSIRLTDPFGKLMAGGLAAGLVLQVFVVVGGVIGLIPETGKALPFLAQGGSSMVANWIMVALMIKLSDAAGRTELEPVPDPSETLTISPEEIAAARAEMEH